MSTYVDPAAQQPQETEQVIGGLEGVVLNNGKLQALVRPDGSTAQNPRRIWIGEEKKEFLPYLQSQTGNRLAFLCRVSRYMQNGEQRRSLWLDQVGPPTVESPAMAGPPQQPQAQGAAFVMPPQQPTVVQPTAQPMQAPVQTQEYLRPHSPEVQARIERQSASNVAAQLLAYLPEEERTLATLFVIAERLRAYFESGMAQAETLDQLMHRAMPDSMGDQPPPHTDDDIPF